MIAAACVLVPLLGAAVLAVLPAGWGARANLLAAAATFGLAACLPWAPAAPGGWLLADGLAAQLAALTGFVGLTAAWFGVFGLGHVEAGAEEGRFAGARPRLHHALFQAVLGCTLLAVLSDNLGATWAALAAAAAAVSLASGLPGTPEAARAAWRGFVPAWAGAALALFGTVALYAAALPVLGPGWAAMSWSGLAEAAPAVPGAMLSLACAVLLVGYGALAGLAPLHGWMPGFCGPGPGAAGPTPAFAVLSGAVPAAALAVLLRLRGVLAANPEAMSPGPPLLALGLLSVLLAGVGLWRRRDVAGLFALCATGHRGVVCLGFGLGTPAATFGGLLHLAAHTLAGAAVLRCADGAARLGRAGHRGGGPVLSHPALGVPLAAGVAASAGLPPFGVFAGGFVVVAEVAREAPWLLVPACAGLLSGAWALVARLRHVCFGGFGSPTPGHGPRAAVPSRDDPSRGAEREPRPGEQGSVGRGEDFARAGGGGEAVPMDTTRGGRPSASIPEGDGEGGEAGPGWADGAPGRAVLVGVWLNLALALALGLLLPAPVAAWMRAAAEALP